MKAEYQGKPVYVHHVSRDKKMALISYNEEKKGIFKVETEDLQNPDEELKAELNRGTF